MGFFRALFAVVAATVLAFLLGMAFDYFRLAFSLPTEGVLMVFPLVAGAAGFVASIIALVLARGGPSASRAGGSTAGATPRARGAKSDEIIPGMPTYDASKFRPATGGKEPGKVEDK